MPSAVLARRSTSLAGLLVAGCLVALPAVGAPAYAGDEPATPVPVPSYARNEPATAVVAPATVYLEATYTGRLRDTEDGTLLRPDEVVVTRRCTGVVVDPDGYVVTNTVCVRPSAEVLQVNALYRLGRTLVQDGRLPAAELDDFVAEHRDSVTFTGDRRRSRPTVTLLAQTGTATSPADPDTAVRAAVVAALPAVDGNAALAKLLQGGLPAVEIGPVGVPATGSTLDILGYGITDSTDLPVTYAVRTRTVQVVGLTGTNRTGVDGQVGPDSRGGPVVDADGRLVALLDTDTTVPGEPVRDLISTANLYRLLESAEVTNRLGPVDSRYRVALGDYFAGRYSTALAGFEEILRLAPDHEGAHTYRDRAATRLDRDGDVRGDAGDWLFYLLSAAAGAAVIAAAGLLRRRLRPRPTHPDPESQPIPEPEPTPEPEPDPDPEPKPDTGPKPIPEPEPEARPEGGAAVGVGAGRGFRADIQGLRALAVVLVVLWHAGVPFVPGGFVGVDVFFVISGYLITAGMAAEIATRGRLSLGRFWARRVRRLLPSAGLVLVASLVLAYLFLPGIRWRDTALDVVSSALYAVNWRLAEQSVDYLAAERAPSIVQHYWSLAVEEQFYLLWPVLLVGVAWLARRGSAAPARWRTLALVAVATVLVTSFVWSVLLVAQDPGRAYFVTTTRLWELAVGALLALVPLRRLSPVVGSVVGWVGAGAIVASALLLDTTDPFPGLLALPATLGTVLVLVAGPDLRYGPVVVLRVAVMQFLGRISYTLYLWHWPLLVVLTVRMDEPDGRAVTAAMALAVFLAYLTSRFVERPAWHSTRLSARPGRTVAVGVGCTVLPVCVGLVLHHVAVGPPTASTAARDVQGAAVLATGQTGEPVDRSASVVPDPSVARDDVASVYADGCHASQTGSRVLGCTYGRANAPFTVAVVGDSHAAQWVPALQEIAAQRDWRLVTHTKSQCPVVDVEVAGGDEARPNRSCGQWNRALRERLAADRPDLVVTSSYNYQVHRDGRLLTGTENETALATALRRTWRGLAEVAPVVVLRDTPAPRRDMADCVSAHREELTRCAVPRVEALAGVGPIQETAAEGLAGVHLVDLNDAICPASRCAPVIGGVLVYRDTNHLTATYARTLAGRLDERLQAVVG
ncbi:SGNH hydrolase domain-containing protein [Micromonospora sp. SH-82]|uniref:SGNH hydrolase domain-containing protein n=1 Tax=Micromonospora sp. SH-82 TaxID=3132938 RepID=UPI003EBF7011